MGTTTVNTEELHKASRTFQTLSGDYTDIYQSLLNTASTMGVAWESPDNLAFVEQINGFSAELQAMVEHMNASAQALDQQAGNYESVVEAHRTQVQKLAN